MAKRTFEFDTTDGQGDALVEVIEHYVEAAYPPGGSQCAAATREAFMTLKEALKKNSLEGPPVYISTRQRPMLKSAVKWFYTESNQTHEPLFARLMAALEKKAN
ncbi:MAG: hypothetical protein ACWA5X_09075 [bacterium]